MRHVLHAGLIAVASAVMFVSTGCTSSRGTALDDNGTPTTRPVALKIESTTNGGGGTTNAAAPMFAAAPIRPDREGMIRGSLAYPTGDPRTSAIILEKAVPAEVIANKAYEYELTVHNVSSVKLDNVEVTETMPAGLKLADKVEGVAFSIADGKAHFKIGTLEAGQRKTFKIGATATAAGAVTNCASVTYDSSLCLGVNVVSPALTMLKTLPTDVMLCERVPLKISLTNNGSGTARNVKLEDKLPEGMTTVDGKTSVSLDLGDIAAGETKNVELPVKLAKTGEYKNTAIATAEDGLRAEATAGVIAHQPILEVVKTGPKQQYVGVPYSYEITVANKGDADAKNCVVTDTLPAGLVASDATEGGKITNGKVVWAIENLPKGTNRVLKLTVKGSETGTAHNTVSATADCATTATVSADTALVGIPAILLEVVDEPDPVAVGMNTTFTIIVTNQGSAVATNVKLVGEMEQQMEFVSSKGSTNGKLDGMTITFEPLATLAPKARAVYTVVVKAKDAGDVRFKTTLTSDQLGRPVDELESTTFYK